MGISVKSRSRYRGTETSAVSWDVSDFKKVHDHMMAFRSDQYLWWQIAEYGYDTYMIRARSRG